MNTILSKTKTLEDINPSTPVSLETPVTQEVVKPNDTSLPQTALSIYKLPDNSGQFVLVEFKFNPVTGSVGEMKEVTRDIREDIIVKFKNAVVEAGFFG